MIENDTGRQQEQFSEQEIQEMFFQINKQIHESYIFTDSEHQTRFEEGLLGSVRLTATMMQSEPGFSKQMVIDACTNYAEQILHLSVKPKNEKLL